MTASAKSDTPRTDALQQKFSEREKIDFLQECIGYREHARQLERELTAALADPVLRGWRTIESAPRDGTEISVAFKSVGVRQVSWQDPYGDDDDCALWCVDDNKHGPYPLRGYSHGDELGWMPLPEPPEVK